MGITSTGIEQNNVYKELSMAKKAGVSHAFSALISIVLASLVVGYYKPYYPRVYSFLEDLARKVSELLESSFSLDIAPEAFVPAFIACFFAFIWGVIYHFLRHGPRKRE
jgi:hypothetical protein